MKETSNNIIIWPRNDRLIDVLNGFRNLHPGWPYLEGIIGAVNAYNG